MNASVRKYANLLKNVRSWPGYLACKLGLSQAPRFELTLRPVPIRVTMPRSSVLTFKEIFLLEEYEPPFRRMATDAPVVLDVGGNIGYFALYAFLRKPRATVYSFEPVPTHFALLSHHRAAHPRFDWMALPVAVADQTGTVDFFYDETHSPDGIDPSASLFSPDENGVAVAEARRLRVETVGLADWLRERRIAHVDLLKLDCEGAEYPILYGLSDAHFPRIHQIIAEVHPGRGARENGDSLADFLQKKGYRVEQHPNGILHAERPELRDAENSRATT